MSEWSEDGWLVVKGPVVGDLKKNEIYTIEPVFPLFYIYNKKFRSPKIRVRNLL